MSEFDYKSWDIDHVLKLLKMGDDDFQERKSMEDFVIALKRVPLNELPFFLLKNGFSEEEIGHFQEWLARVISMLAFEDEANARESTLALSLEHEPISYEIWQSDASRPLK